MSFILDALRKSEKERRANQPESATDRILTDVDESPYRRRTALWIGLATCGILLLLAGFFWFAQQEPEPISARKPAATAPSTANPDSSQMANTSEQPSVPVDSPQPATVENAADSSQASRPTAARHAPLMLRKKASPANRQDVPNETVAQASPAAATTPPPAMDEEAETDEDTADEGDSETDTEKNIEEEEEEPEPVAAATAVPNAVVAEEPSPPKPAADIPFLEELPYEVRQSIPKMTVNVVYYSANPAERFVIINMKKYKTGERTMDSVDLKEIRRDSLVLSYQNQTFRLEKP